VYIPTARTLTVNIASLNASAVAKWFDPTNGSYTMIPGGPIANACTNQFTPPGNNHGGDDDWVLELITSTAGSNRAHSVKAKARYLIVVRNSQHAHDLSGCGCIGNCRQRDNRPVCGGSDSGACRSTFVSLAAFEVDLQLYLERAMGNIRDLARSACGISVHKAA
jgi:hypothetical protein